jgi:uncharacterized protein YegL
MPKQGLTEIVVLLDRSGSMQTIVKDAIGGFNAFLEEQKKQDGEATMTVVQFDDEYLVTVEAVNIHDVAPLNEETFVPRGMTALLDAIGRTVNDVGDRLAKTEEANRPEKVIVVILTDGHENASMEFKRTQINKLITHQKKKYSWEFLFLAAGQDAIAEANSIGIGKLNTMSFVADAKGINTSYSAMGTAVSMYRSVGEINESWKENEHKENKI